jgi:FixJ family two-component response regulator
MPGTTGLDLHRELKLRGRQIPTIFMTAKRGEAVRARALEQGAVKFLYKPFNDKALLEALNEPIQVK